MLSYSSQYPNFCCLGLGFYISISAKCQEYFVHMARECFNYYNYIHINFISLELMNTVQNLVCAFSVKERDILHLTIFIICP